MVFYVCQLELLFSLFLKYEDIREGFMENGPNNRKSVCTIGSSLVENALFMPEIREETADDHIGCLNLVKTRK